MPPLPGFDFATAQRILFGAGVFDQVGKLAAEQGRHVFLVAGASAFADGGAAGRLAEQLALAGVALTTFTVEGEPEIASVTAATSAARQAGVDVVIGLGGGSALDMGKAVAGLLTNSGEPLDYMEVVGRGKVISQPAAPYIAVATTAGPGAEVTRNAVVLSREYGVKASIRSPYLLPRVAVVDPLLTHTLPPDATAATGLDALTQLIEPYVSRRANPLTDALIASALPRGATALPRAWTTPDDADARADMAFASLCGGLALANAGLGAVHGFAAPLGGAYPIPHGVACALLLAPVMAANVAALRAMEPEAKAGPSTAGATLRRYVEVGGMLTGEWGADAIEAGVEWVRDRVKHFGLGSLARYGIRADDLPDLARRAEEASSMRGNPVTLSHATLVRILERAL